MTETNWKMVLDEGWGGGPGLRGGEGVGGQNSM